MMIKLLAYIVSALFTYILGIISKKKKWHETLPIPMQNLIVGAIVFVISIIIVHILKENISIQDILEQIMVALGGTGTATLAYDTQKARQGK